MPDPVPGRKSDRLAACLCGVLVLGCAGQMLAQTADPPAATDTVPRSASGQLLPQPTDGVRRLPADAFRPEPDFGVRYRTLFRGTAPPYVDQIRPISVSPTAVLSDSIQTRVNLGIPDFRGRFPLLDRSFEPEDADIKAGPIFFKLHALSAGVLASDNINHEEHDPESDVIAIVRIGGTLSAQLTEGLSIALSGSFIWLPTKGEFGISGFGLFAPYALGLEGIPALESQISWDTMIGHWNVLVADDFRMSFGRFSTSTQDELEFFEGGQFDQVDTAGRYTFRGPRPETKNDRFTQDDTDVNLSYFSNVVSVTTERLLPGPARLKIRLYHENLWYNQGSRGEPDLRDNTTNTDDLANTRDGLSLLLISERENLRFNPYLVGRITQTDQIEGFTEEIRLGLVGPITDQLHLNINAGVFHRDDNNSTRFVWGLALRHLAGPYTQESLIAGSDYGDFTEELTTHITYRLRQVIGPKNVAQAYVSLANVEDLKNGSLNRNEFRAGVRDTWYLGPRTTLRAAFLYSMLAYDAQFGDEKTYTLQLETTYHFTDTLYARLLYQYRTRDSQTRDQSYDENLVFLSLTKYFE